MRKTRVAVCVATYRRPEGLKYLLNDFDRLEFHKCQPPSIEIIVVDNDAAGAACKLCKEIGFHFGWSLKCYVEPRRGIPYARNKAISCVEEGTDFVAFIDDDEVPAASWLDELLHIQHSHGADVVAGPVLPRFTEDVPGWVLKGEFFEPERYPTGHLLNLAYSGNVLVRSEVFKGMTEHFDERYALTGGSDTQFFMRVHRAGYKMVWADDALAYEWVTKKRANARWILRRTYRGANGFIRQQLVFKPWIVVAMVRVPTASIRLVQGLLLIPLSLVLGKHVFVKGLRYIAHGTGLFAGFIGKPYEEYGKQYEKLRTETPRS